MKTDLAFDALKDWVAAANPGFVTQQDLAKLEGRLDELLGLVDEVEARLQARSTPASAPEPASPAKSGEKRPRRPQ